MCQVCEWMPTNEREQTAFIERKIAIGEYLYENNCELFCTVCKHSGTWTAGGEPAESAF